MNAVKEKSILSKEHHARLLQDIASVVATARIPEYMLHRPMAAYCTKAMVDWVKAYPEYMASGSGGMCITGNVKGVATQMQAIAAAFLRNYKDARVIPIHNLLKPDEDPENPTVLLIPDFFLKSVSGRAAFTNWQIRELYGMILDRYVSRRATILYVQDMKRLDDEYGDAMADLINSHWTLV